MCEMSNAFLKVFPELLLNKQLNELMKEVSVLKIVNVTSGGYLRIHIESTYLIEKSKIIEIEKAITKMINAAGDHRIAKIYEHFKLSEQYNIESIFDMYLESMLMEIKEYSHSLYIILKKAKLNLLDENNAVLVVEERAYVKEGIEELICILNKILIERCGINAKLGYEFSKEKKAQKDNTEFLERKVEQIQTNYISNIENNEDTNEVKTENSKKANRDKGINNKEQKQQKEVYTAKKTGFKAKGEYKRPLKNSDNPDIIFGRDIEENTITIEEIAEQMGEVNIKGKIINFDSREIKNEKMILIFDITDFTDTITVKLFIRKEQSEELLPELKKGKFIKVKGIANIDNFDKEMTITSVVGIKKIADFTHKRIDLAAEKRVELHCHTKMSDMDGVSEVGDIVKRAYSWGHKAVAITDHGVVQSFPSAFHVWEDLWKAEKNKRKEAGEENPNKQDFFKVIYGCEAYLVDDMKNIASGNITEEDCLGKEFVVFDIETTGFSPVKNRIIEIGAVKVKEGKVIGKFSEFVNPKVPIPFEIVQLTGIQDSMVIDAPTINEILPKFLEFSKDSILVAHNASFDMSFIIENTNQLVGKRDFTYMDTLALSRLLFPEQNKHTLDFMAKTLKVVLENHHRAIDDAVCTAEIFFKLMDMCKEKGITSLKAMNDNGSKSEKAIAKLAPSHVILLAQNDIGRVNLYTMVSMSHLQYFNRNPKIPRSVLEKFREGILIGSACESGELFKALLDEKSEETISKIVSFYDYLEIQPVSNHRYMVNSKRFSSIQEEKDIIEINKRIVKLGEQFNKPVVATGDAHFLDPEDEIYRKIILAGKGFSGSSNDGPLYFRTTDEMLGEFQYLGSDKAYEVVIKNSNMIADKIESIAPVRPDKCVPIIPNSDQMLRDICYNRAHEMYGEELVPQISDRLERELNSIIKNGFAVMYIIAQKLVWKSVEDGYLVGSRGSVGSSFVATMAGITEVNPLPPHYYCEKCHYTEFESQEITEALDGGRSGCDLPAKVCPNCGASLRKDGFDIPFETFLGFKGDKEPDIDLNFSGEYQSKAHKYTEVIFGAGQTYRAGTVGTIADKTAFGYVMNYFSEREIHKRKSEVARIAVGCTGIRRSTGQHPGGIIVLPLGENINSFTPVQHPANDMTTDIITTHFDYHSIDHNLLKLDILGHDDPTMIRMLQDLTEIDPVGIALDDPDVMSLFQNTKALGISPDQLDGIDLGSLGIPEFGTEFVFQMLRDTKPQTFSDLVRISGLGHGTDVWLGNAQTLILEGKATIASAICTRDDIMTYLIRMGVDSALSFTIMESVRKGKGLKDEWVEEMTKCNVPDWYIWSCKKIKYMFPKAHAAAYVMMAWRIGYFKIHYPLAYYAAYFSIRASGFSYEIMCLGEEHLREVMKDYKNRMDSLSKKEQDTYKDMKSVLELYARGIEFIPIDIFRAHSRNFQIIEGKIMPAFSSIDGLGDSAAEAMMQAAKNGPFLSREDLRQRTKTSKTVVDKMGELGLLNGLPESSQMSIFDL